MPYDEEVLLPFSALRSAIPPVTRCKSTLLVSSLRTLKETGHYARYAELLDRAIATSSSSASPAYGRRSSSNGLTPLRGIDNRESRIQKHALGAIDAEPLLIPHPVPRFE